MDRQKRNALRKRLRQLWLYVGLPLVLVSITALVFLVVRNWDKIWAFHPFEVTSSEVTIPETGEQQTGETGSEFSESAEQDSSEPRQTETDDEEAGEQQAETSKPEETAPAETETVSQITEPSEPEHTEPPQTDVTAPVLGGVQNQTVEVGSNISYKRNVTYIDDSGECDLIIDTSGVDLNTVGTYEVVYTAVDGAGNSTSQTIVVTVINPTEVTEEEIYKMADEVIASCITEDMTLYEKAEALWNWCHYQIKYSYSSGDRGLLAGAYEGLHDRRGDCYAYYATYEVLLTRVGIENMCVTRIGGNSNHWWNLVNLGDGWYHCDASPRKIGHKYKCFMQTDAQIAAYSDAYVALYPDHPNYFVFESDLYPERATEIIFESQIP